MLTVISTTTSVLLLLLTHKEEKGANGGRFSQLLPGTSIHPTQQLACLLYVARPTQSTATAALLLLPPPPCAAPRLLLRRVRHSLLLRAEFHTGAGDQWPQQHCRKGMKKKYSMQKTITQYLAPRLLLCVLELLRIDYFTPADFVIDIYS